MTVAGYLALAGTTREWFRSDVALRSRLAVAAARQGLAAAWGDRDRLLATLVDITRDERIMGAAACSSSGAMLAATDGYPEEFSCRSVARMHHPGAHDQEGWSTTS